MSEETPSLRDTIESIAGDEVDGDLITPEATDEEISIATASEDVASVPEAGGETVAAEDEVVEATPSIEPPNSWRADKKDVFRQLPPDVQEYIAERESQRDAYLNQKGQKYSELEKVFEPLEDDWNRAGLSPGKVVTQLLAWDKYIREKPLDAIQELASRAGIDLAQFAQVQQAQGPQDPYVRYTLAEVERLKAEQAAEREKIKEEKEKVFYQGLDSEIERFRLSTKDGQPAFPHFSTVRKAMGQIFPLVVDDLPNASTQEMLEEAYNRAIRVNPSTFAAFQKDLETKRELETRKKLQSKKYAGSSISGSPEGGKIDRPMTLRETIEAANAGRI